MKRRTRKQVKADRLWRHWLFWLSDTPMGRDLRLLENYNPERWRKAFEWFQSYGPLVLAEDELDGIYPLICAQRAKEVVLTSLAEESMEWWAKGQGWVYPWLHTLQTKGLDRLTRVAILRTMKSIAKDPVSFFNRHPGLTPKTKERFFSLKAA
jgi:hypothetical protein